MTLERASQLQRITAAIFAASLLALFVVGTTVLPAVLLGIFVVLQVSMWTSIAMLIVIWRKKKLLRANRNG
jgi:hypothetical protein